MCQILIRWANKLIEARTNRDPHRHCIENLFRFLVRCLASSHRNWAMIRVSSKGDDAPAVCGVSSTASAAADEAAADGRVTVSTAAFSQQKGRCSRKTRLVDSTPPPFRSHPTGARYSSRRARRATRSRASRRRVPGRRDPMHANPSRRCGAPADGGGTLTTPRRRRGQLGPPPAHGGGGAAAARAPRRPAPHGPTNRLEAAAGRDADVVAARTHTYQGGGAAVGRSTQPTSPVRRPPSPHRRSSTPFTQLGRRDHPCSSASAFLGKVRSLPPKAPHLATPPPPPRW